jgi:hypothetical protein
VVGTAKTASARDDPRDATVFKCVISVNGTVRESRWWILLCVRMGLALLCEPCFRVQVVCLSYDKSSHVVLVCP